VSYFVNRASEQVTESQWQSLNSIPVINCYTVDWRGSIQLMWYMAWVCCDASEEYFVRVNQFRQPRFAGVDVRLQNQISAKRWMSREFWRRDRRVENAIKCHRPSNY